MTRTWVNKYDHRYVMQCDQPRCTTRSEPFPSQPDLGLFQERGWFVAALFGDVCPTCLANGAVPDREPYVPRHNPR